MKTAEYLTISTYQAKLGLAQLPAGSRVLELGCGWGSLSLANAAKYGHVGVLEVIGDSHRTALGGRPSTA